MAIGVPSFMSLNFSSLWTLLLLSFFLNVFIVVGNGDQCLLFHLFQLSHSFVAPLSLNVLTVVNDGDGFSFSFNST